MRLEAEWVTGFVDGEGCFYVGINPHREMRSGFQVLPEFTVVQHERDEQLLHALQSFFGCGVVRTNHGDRKAFRVRGKDNLQLRVIPFFQEHPLRSKKRFDFERFREVLSMMEMGVHLTTSGIAVIREIASQMNRGQSR
jgi:hypothetical protein